MPFTAISLRSAAKIWCCGSAPAGWVVSTGAVLSADEAWMLRFFDQRGRDRLLIVNLGGDVVHLDPAPEPSWQAGGGSPVATPVVE